MNINEHLASLTEEQVKEFWERSEKAEKLREGYRLAHECCPKCNATDHMSTLVAYVFDMNRPEEYKDYNKCTCMTCDDKHTVHNRVPKKL